MREYELIRSRRKTLALELIRETLELTERDILIPFSAEKGSGKDELLRLLVDACRG